MSLQMLVVFRQPIGLRETTANVVQALSFAVWLVFFVLWWRQWKAIKSGKVAPAAPTHIKSRAWLIAALLVIASLSGVFWLPYTGVALTFPQLVFVSVTTCVLSVVAFLIGRRLARPRV